MIEYQEKEISDVLEIFPKVYGDDRGCFLESYNQKSYAQIGIPEFFAQDNISVSSQYVLRGLHYQNPQPQGKLVQAISGRVFDVAVDLRKNSTSFGKWVSTILDDQTRNQLWVPPGFAHGFMVLSKKAVFSYKASDYYAPQHEQTIIWNDPDIGIEWPVADPSLIIVSDKDRKGSSFTDANHFI